MRRICILMLALLLCSCGSRTAVVQDGNQADDNSPLAALQPGPEIAAPQEMQFPDGLDAVERSLSDDSIKLLGRDWIDKSETAEEIGTTLELNGPDNTWGIYALGGFGGVEAGSVYASFWTDEDSPCRLYIAVADFNTGHWVFADAGKDDFSYVFPANGLYHSETGNCYIAVLRVGEGDAKLYSLTIGRIGDTNLEAPADLSASADPGIVHLGWQAVGNAVGYNVYRAYDRKFTDQVKLNAEPITEAGYEDDWLVSGEMYFYRVTSVAAIESIYSNAVNVYVPAADLPAPQNLRVLSVGDFDFEIAWDWEGPSPNGWEVYMANAPDFNLEPPTIKKNIPQGGTRKYKFSGLDPGRLYFVRLAAKDSNGALGRMTDALPCLTGDQWEWYDIEEIGDGKEPIAAVIADDKICAAYMLDNVVHVARNNGVGEPWVVEGTDLDKSITYWNSYVGKEISAGGFEQHLDVDYKDGTYLITSVTALSHDFYAAIGAPEAGWDVELIDEGTGGGFQAPTAGLYCSVAISDNGYNASGVDFYGGGLKWYTRPYGKDKPWQKHDFFTIPESWPAEMDFEVRSGSLFASSFDFIDRELYLWSEDLDEFTQVTDNPEGWTYGLLFTDLEWLGDHWGLIAYDGYNRDLMLLEDKGNPTWDQYLVTDTDDYKTGKGCRMEPFRDGLVCVYMGGGIRDWYCSVLRGNGEWETQLMKIGEIDAYERADLKILDDKPVFIVADRITKKVYAIRGNIPPE
ncbi:MAG: fibronectin type III domain-containing protein [Planctomycetales bacterium]|nr:fibronectin type III domain-containing protein [bacterium]UNM09399.1 MAG: fibronectin type III domain-containing protein [Planctomycetales bacterium]